MRVATLLQSEIKALSTLPQPKPGPLHNYLANLLSIAYSDGELSPNEDNELDKVLSRLGASARDLDTAFNIVASGNYQGHLSEHILSK